MAFCIKCGKKLNESDSFCPNCGNKVVKKVVVSNDDNINQESNLNVDANKENQPINHQQIIDQAKKSLNNLKQLANSQIKERPINISINQKFEKSTLVALISSAVVMISAFLPCISSISVSRFSVSMNISLMDIAKYMDYFDVSNDAASSGVFLSGICLVILAIGTIVGILMKNEKLELILGACTSLFGLYETYLVSQIISASDSISKGTGYHLMMLGSIVLLFAIGIDFLNAKYHLSD